MKYIRAKQGNTALIKDGKVPIIGYIDNAKFAVSTDFSRHRCTVVSFDINSNGQSDVFIFCKKSLVIATIHENRDLPFALEIAQMLPNLNNSADFVKKYVSLYLTYGLSGKMGN